MWPDDPVCDSNLNLFYIYSTRARAHDIYFLFKNTCSCNLISFNLIPLERKFNIIIVYITLLILKFFKNIFFYLAIKLLKNIIKKILKNFKKFKNL